MIRVAQWHQERRPWRECLEVYVQAARGLAAAHAKGLVQRAVELRAAAHGPASELAEARFVIARARLPEEEAGAMALAQQARDALDEGELRREIDAWLAERG